VTDDNRKLAEDVWNKQGEILFGDTTIADEKNIVIAIIAAYGEARFKAGVEAMRECALACLWGNIPHDVEAIDEEADRLLEAK